VCGPIGSFQQQIDYLGDARVLFDYFFPGVLGAAWTQSNITIPAELIAERKPCLSYSLTIQSRRRCR